MHWIRRVFWGWWEHLSYSMLSSFFGSLNPFFLLIIATFTWSFTADSQLMLESPWFFIVLIGTSVMAIPFFPTTLAAFSAQAYVLTEGPAGFFAFYRKELFRLFLRSLGYTFLFALIGFLLSFSIWFYHVYLNFMAPFNELLTVFSVWFYLTILVMQFYLIPELIDENDGVIANFAVAFLMVFRKMKLMLGAFVFSSFVSLLMIFPAVSRFTAIVPLITVIGFQATAVHWVYWTANEEIPPSLQEEKKRGMKDIFSPFTAFFGKKKKKK